MTSFEERLGLWAGILSTAAAITGLVQSRRWLVIAASIALVASLGAMLFARRERIRRRRAQIEIEGRSIDCLNVANLSRRTNTNLRIQEVLHKASIQNADLEFSFTYTGHCRARRGARVFEFSVDSESFIPFANLDCFAFDLRLDPHMSHRIRPILLGPDGISKKIAVPFAEALRQDDAFSIRLICRLPNSMKPGIEFCGFTHSFAQELIPSYTVELQFAGLIPEWVRVYYCDSSGCPQLLKDLTNQESTRAQSVYRDVVENVPGQSARIYLFKRAE